MMRKKRYLPHEFDSPRWPNGRLPFGQQFLHWHNHVNFQFDTPTVDFTYPVASRTRVQSSGQNKYRSLSLLHVQQRNVRLGAYLSFLLFSRSRTAGCLLCDCKFFRHELIAFNSRRFLPPSCYLAKYYTPCVGAALAISPAISTLACNQLVRPKMVRESSALHHHHQSTLIRPSSTTA